MLTKKYARITTTKITYLVSGDNESEIDAKATVGPLDWVLSKEGVQQVGTEVESRTVCLTEEGCNVYDISNDNQLSPEAAELLLP